MLRMWSAAGQERAALPLSRLILKYNEQARPVTLVHRNGDGGASASSSQGSAGSAARARRRKPAAAATRRNMQLQVSAGSCVASVRLDSRMAAVQWHMHLKMCYQIS